jgi:hypothetical protein
MTIGLTEQALLIHCSAKHFPPVDHAFSITFYIKIYRATQRLITFKIPCNLFGIIYFYHHHHCHYIIIISIPLLSGVLSLLHMLVSRSASSSSLYLFVIIVFSSHLDHSYGNVLNEPKLHTLSTQRC